MEEPKKRSAIQPIFYNLAVVERLREANKAKRATGDVQIRIKTR